MIQRLTQFISLTVNGIPSRIIKKATGRIGRNSSLNIADFLGEDCEAMKDRRHGGYYLKDYMLKKAVLATLAALAALSSAHRKQLSCSKCVRELHFG